MLGLIMTHRKLKHVAERVSSFLYIFTAFELHFTITGTFACIIPPNSLSNQVIYALLSQFNSLMVETRDGNIQIS